LKKTFLLTNSKKNPQRVLDSIKNNIRKYIKREKRKPLPDNSNFWNINCKFGQNKETAIEIKYEDIMKCINEASEQNLESFYIELSTTAGTMKFKKKIKNKNSLDDNDIESNEEEVSVENNEENNLI
jgi:uncharacterized protein YqgV (UPF0045/DUF77 family)